MGLNVRSDTFGIEAGIGRASGPLDSGAGVRGASPHAGIGRASGALDASAGRFVKGWVISVYAS